MQVANSTQIIQDFHRLWYTGPGKQTIRWLGWPLMKNPVDLWIYQHLLTELQPDIIIETGTYSGGSALYLAMICDALGVGEIISIDNGTLNIEARAEHPRITFLHGDSASSRILRDVKKKVQHQRTLVILDSDHSKDHVLNELNAYAPLVTPGSYCIVEDTNINGHPVKPEFGPGPWEAIETWLPQHPEFEQDFECERYLLTWNPGGFLRRK